MHLQRRRQAKLIEQHGTQSFGEATHLVGGRDQRIQCALLAPN